MKKDNWITIVVGILGAILTSIINFLLPKIGVNTMNIIYQIFIDKIWPLWIGIIIAIIYKLVKSYINFKKSYIDFNNWIFYHNQNYKIKEFSSLEDKINYLIQCKLDPEYKNKEK